jgi:hypothetical protein
MTWEGYERKRLWLNLRYTGIFDYEIRNTRKTSLRIFGVQAETGMGTFPIQVTC